MTGRRTAITHAGRPPGPIAGTAARASVTGLVVLALVGAALTWHATRGDGARGGSPPLMPGAAASSFAGASADASPSESRAAPPGVATSAPVARPVSAVGATPTAAPSPTPTAQPDDALRLTIPYRSQFDGSTFEWGNCGVSAISMAMEYYGHAFSTHDVRLSINRLTGNWDTQIGVDWRYLRTALEERGFSTEGPHTARGGYIAWTLDDVLARAREGRPVMLLLHYRSLPGHEEDEWIGDHYLLILGETRDGRIVYHDPGFEGDRGAYMTIDRERLEHAWSNTWIGQNRTAMAILPPE